LVVFMMDYVRSYKSFINSHYLSEGIRMTIGILLPALIMSYFDMLHTGIVISVGALSVSITDNAGPIKHRRMGMAVCIASIFLVAVTTGFAAYSPVLLGIMLFVFCFFFSMLGVFGMRATSIGIASLLVLVLNIDKQMQGLEIFRHALFVVGGGVWYMLFSLLLYSVWPYKLAQQALGDYIQSCADYLRTRALLYEKTVDYDAIYRNLLQEQTIVQEKQNLLSELLFKTRNIVKESTNTSRILMMSYMDAADLFERLMTSYQDYSTLHRFFDDTNILKQFNILALDIAAELDEIGIAVKSGNRSIRNPTLWNHIHQTKEIYRKLRQNYLNPGNIEGFIILRAIIDNIEDIAERIHTLHSYTTYDPSLTKRPAHQIDYNNFISHQEITPDIFRNNLTLRSNIFRHSLRVSFAVLTGYLISGLINLGHSYWILLTIIVILKPEYSLSKKRNTDRLIGTVCGVLIGALILYLVRNGTALLLIMIALMTASYSFLRKHYFVSVLLMTPYIILFFYLLNPNNFTLVLKDRILDTAIGSVIAFIASVFLVPAWEHTTIKTYMTRMLEENSHYFLTVSKAFSKQQGDFMNQHQLARKNALVALANLSDAFNRMISEPTWKQIGIKHIHQFVVLNHMLSSHIATLSYYFQSETTPFRSDEIRKISNDILQYLTNSIEVLKNEPVKAITITHKDSLRKLNEQVFSLLDKRKKELEQGKLETSTKKPLHELKSVVDQYNFIYKIVEDIYKVTRNLEKE
jgi:uncharacterized membrane protein (TIGR01666 family)